MATATQLPQISHSASVSAEDAVLVLDSQRRIQQITPRAAVLLGRTAAELFDIKYDELGSLESLGLAAREQAVYRKTRRASLTIVTLWMVDFVSGIHDRLVEPWQTCTELAIVRGGDGRILAVNEAFARKFGVPRKAWSGMETDSLVHPDDKASWQAAIARIQLAPYRGSHEHRWQTAQGWRWLAWEDSAVRDQEGGIVAFRSIGRDVTKRRLAEEHFYKLASAVEQSPFSIVMTTLDGRVQYVNPKFSQSTGYTLEEIFEREIRVLREGHANEESFRGFEETVKEGRKWSGELCTRCKDGRLLWEYVQVSPIRNNFDEVTHLLCMREDITERKRLEDQLRQAQKMESLGTLAGGIAHDFNNVLAIINGFAEIALSRGPADDIHTRHLKEIHNAAQRAIGLVRQILTFSRKAEISFKAVSLNQHIRDLGRMCAETFPRTISFEFGFDETLPEIAADPNQLDQVIMNLCVNARDAMTAGGRITVATSRVPGQMIVRLGAEAEREYACITVSDTGCGMPPHVRARIFEPFFTTKQNSGGTGLGLSVVYGIILNHKGMLDVDSDEGQGTMFRIYLPIDAVKLGTTPPSIVPAAGSPIPRGTETVLVVEDERSLRDLLKALLVPAGYKVLIAEDGEQALEVMMSEPGVINAILLDLNLPKVNGVDVYRNILRIRPEAKVIVISGNIVPDVRRELMQLGQNEFLPKPYQLVELGRRLRGLLDSVGASTAA